VFVTRKWFSRVLPKKADLYQGVWSWTREYPDELQILTLKFSSTEVFSPTWSQPVLIYPRVRSFWFVYKSVLSFAAHIIFSSLNSSFLLWNVFITWYFPDAQNPWEPLRESYRCSLDGKNGSGSFYSTTALTCACRINCNNPPYESHTDREGRKSSIMYRGSTRPLIKVCKDHVEHEWILLGHSSVVTALLWVMQH
jgi:hypothetical protein